MTIHRFPYSDAILCLALLAALILATYYMAGWAFGADKVTANLLPPPPVTPGWIFCSNPDNQKRFDFCHQLRLDGPIPAMIENK